MTTAAEIRAGMALRLDGTVYRVLGCEAHKGGGKMGGVVHARLQSIDSGGQTERRFRPEERVEAVDLQRRTLGYLYRDADCLIFMDPDSFDQIPVPAALLGPLADFLEENARLPVEFFEERPVRVVPPEFVDVRVASTAAPTRQGEKSTWKAATLENGIEVQVPLFIAPGDLIRVQVATRRYAERVKGSGRH